VAALGAVATGAAAGAAAADGTPVLCPCRLVLGVPCPFCGLTHSLLAAGQGDLAHAFALNPLGLVAPLVAVALLVALVRALRADVPLAWPRPLLAIGLALVALSWIVQLEKGIA
jgi:hypothetical protein